jgi:hypothetical protein
MQRTNPSIARWMFGALRTRDGIELFPGDARNPTASLIHKFTAPPNFRLIAAPTKEKQKGRVAVATPPF